MAEVEPMQIDAAEVSKPIIEKKKQSKRKRVDPSFYTPSPDEKNSKIAAFRSEIDSLVKFCKDLALQNRAELLENADKVGNGSGNGVIACLMEESDLPLSKLVDEIFERVKENGDGVSKVAVKSSVLIIGQRLYYGVPGADADVLEDETESALWCWETRDLKLMPKLMRAHLKVRRTCRKKIHERITAVLAMINALEKSENHPQELMKASEKLNKVLNEADIRLLMESTSHKNGDEMAEKEAKRDEKLLIKQMEKNKREMEKKRKKMDQELQREKLQSEKELKRLHDEAQKEEKRREKEENEIQKQLKRQQEEAEKEQRRKEKEEADLRKKLTLQKQASLMERFLKRNKTDSSSTIDNSTKKSTVTDSLVNTAERMSESVSQAMDSVLSQDSVVELEDIWNSHLNGWRGIGRSIRSNSKMHWGIRQKPKNELVKELKLTTNKELPCDLDMNIEKVGVGCVDSNADGKVSELNTDRGPLPCGKKRIPAKKLLQFDKSFRPAFYGVWPKQSQVVGARHPLVKDPDIDYEIDSDEEWEEDEPGESLSDCDKDDEDESMEGCTKDDDEDESEDGFFVPDGYLSENEGAVDDEMDSEDLAEEEKDTVNLEQQSQSEEFCILLRQQKYLNNLTEHALKKNQPLIILNLMHEKTTTLSAEELTGTSKLERMCLQTLSVRPLPGFPDIEISIHSDGVDEDQEASANKLSIKPLASAATLLDSDLPQIISIIQSCPHSIGKIERSLHEKFPDVPKTHLRNKVREISQFCENRWQVKKEILSKHGFSTSPEKNCGKTKTRSIATFLKRCLPPSGNLIETSPPQSSKKPSVAVESQQVRSCEHQ